MTDSMPAAHQPIEGIRVIEIGTSVAGPYAGLILAGLGADVIKVERPGPGDDARQWGRIFPGGTSSIFHSLNRDKRGITVDLKDEGERRWLRALCAREADVVIQNMRPGRADKYGLGGAELTAGNSRLVYCNLWAYGNRGPLKDRPGYDPLMQAAGGIMSVTGEDGRPPVRVGTSIVDMGTGLWSAIGILAALNRRAATGLGCVVDASLYETALAWMTNDRLFARLAEALGHPEWPEDPRFDTNQNRYRNLSALNVLIEPIVGTQPRQYWRGKLDEAGVPSAPVRDTIEMMADEQTEALGIIQEMEGAGPRLMGLPLSFDGARPPLRRMAPSIGEHDDEIKGTGG